MEKGVAVFILLLWIEVIFMSDWQRGYHDGIKEYFEEKRIRARNERYLFSNVERVEFGRSMYYMRTLLGKGKSLGFFGMWDFTEEGTGFHWQLTNSEDYELDRSWGYGAIGVWMWFRSTDREGCYDFVVVEFEEVGRPKVRRSCYWNCGRRGDLVFVASSVAVREHAVVITSEIDTDFVRNGR